MERSRYLPVICLAVTFASVFALLGCASVEPMFCGLERGMTEEEFMTGAPAKCAERGLNPQLTIMAGSGSSGEPDNMVRSMGMDRDPDQSEVGISLAPDRTTVSVGDDVWVVWAYEVYRSPVVGFGTLDHYEYVILKNKRVVAWGSGYPSRAVRKHPEQVPMAE